MKNSLYQKRILLVEDDQDLADLLIQFLQDEYVIIHTAYPHEALNQVGVDDVDIILLDLTLPQMDGLVLCKELAKISNAKIIISSARSDIDDKIEAFKYGALDYLPKPYDPRELKIRIELLLPQEEICQLFYLDEKKLVLQYDKNSCELSGAEAEIFSILFRNQAQLLSREMIANAMQSHSFESSLDSIIVLIGRLRKKLLHVSQEKVTIKNVRLVGYSLESL